MDMIRKVRLEYTGELERDYIALYLMKPLVRINTYLHTGAGYRVFVTKGTMWLLDTSQQISRSSLCKGHIH